MANEKIIKQKVEEVRKRANEYVRQKVKGES